MEHEIAETVYETFLETIKEPVDTKKIFHIPDGNKLGICLIEFRQKHWLKYILYQIAHVYGGNDVSLYIVHGTKNGNFLKEFVKDWGNVQFIEYPYETIDHPKYAEICCDVEFYKHFNTQFVLKMEWDSFIRKPIPDAFFEYAYVGAPWLGYPNEFPDNPHIQTGNKKIGNGGFSLRNVKKMIEVCSRYKKPAKLGEDVHITNCLKDSDIPDYEMAKEFSVEWVYHPDPVGLHHVWTIFPIETFMKWLKNK
jgi:hypothetical protein